MDLESQVRALRQLTIDSIPSTFPLPLPPESRMAVNAFVVLAHACIEEFIEDLFMTYATTVSQAASEGVSHRDYAALAYSAGSNAKDKASFRARSIEHVMRSALEFVGRQVAANHGVKASNIERLAECAGLDWTEFDNALSGAIADLTTLGAKRGDAGHLSPFTTKSVFLSDIDGPEDVVRWVDEGVTAARAIEAYLEGLLSEPQWRFLCDLDGN